EQIDPKALGQVRMLLEVGEHLVTALGQAGLAVGVPGPGTGEDPAGLGAVDQLGGAVDPGPVEDLEMSLAERWRQLVLDHLHPGRRPDDLVASLEGFTLANVQADRAVELERVASGGGLRVAVDHSDLLSKL